MDIVPQDVFYRNILDIFLALQAGLGLVSDLYP